MGKEKKKQETKTPENKMEITEVDNLPLSDRGMNEKLAKIIKTLEEMNEGSVIEITDPDNKPMGTKSRVKSAMKRVPSATFKVVVSKNKVYVQKVKDLIPKKEE